MVRRHPAPDDRLRDCHRLCRCRALGALRNGPGGLRRGSASPRFYFADGGGIQHDSCGHSSRGGGPCIFSSASQGRGGRFTGSRRRDSRFCASFRRISKEVGGGGTDAPLAAQEERAIRSGRNIDFLHAPGPARGRSRYRHGRPLFGKACYADTVVSRCPRTQCI